VVAGYQVNVAAPFATLTWLVMGGARLPSPPALQKLAKTGKRVRDSRYAHSDAAQQLRDGVPDATDTT
jgi:hypothetical protein